MDNLTRDEELALQATQTEKVAWESAYAFVTPKVAFNMRNVVEQCRKNYWGVFDSPIDPTTGREKIWQHLTKQFVDFVVKNIDLDTKDINFRAKHSKAIGLTNLVRHIVRNNLDEARFGETLDLLIRQLAIDGTIVVSAEDRKGKLDVRLVDLLNFYIDPVARSISEADSVIERIVLPISEFNRLAKKNSWKNSDIAGSLSVGSPGNTPTNTKPKTNLTYVELFRRRGLTQIGNTFEPYETISSCTDGTWLFHSMEKRKDNKDKGYEEAWYTRILGRWYGEGVAERLAQYQVWYNTTRGIRINRSYLTQLGLWAIRKGAGITPQMLSRLAANGAIPVGDVNNDIKQIPMQDASPASYKDDEIIYTEAQRTTGAFDTAVGDALPASTPATNAAIQSQSSATGFNLIREGVGMFLERWLTNQILPIVMKNVKVNDLIRMQCDQDELLELDEMIVNRELYEQLEAVRDQGLVIDPMQVEMERQRALASLQKFGKQRFVELLQNIDVTDYDVKVYITNEEFDKGVMTQNINQMMSILAPLGMAEVVIELARQNADLMGLDASKIKMPQQAMGMAYNDQQATNPATQPGGNSPAIGNRTLIDNVAPGNTLEPG